MKPICRISSFGDKVWRLNSSLHRALHREDGPAIEYSNGDKFWYINGKCHREDGPAIELFYGAKFWYYKGKHISCKDNQEFLRIVKLMTFL